ncbi:MAG: MBL fold metallo-hydrolase [Rikenellaceae bacterium]|nr:MBL fold metallo-hydrolase [Rikenellaceae bacterium]
MKKTVFISLLVIFCSVRLAAQELYSHRVGNNEVILLSEGEGEGDTGILIDATPNIIETYAPDGTFPMATNVFLVKRHGKNILIDTGYGRKLFENLAALGLNPEDIHEIMLTHMHGDHIGGLLKDGQRAFPEARLIVSKAEHDYWTSTEQMNLLPEDKRGNFRQAMEVVEKYGEDVQLIDPLKIEEVPARCGIHPVEAYGHTPGHIGFMIVCGTDRMLVWGDLAHAMAVQMPHPEIAVTYDIDPETAVKSRLYILRYVSSNNIPVAGMHIPYPALGEITGEGTGYVFTPFD